MKKVIVFGVAAALAAVLVSVLPDLKRYIDISRM
ncbi:MULTISPECIES: DUF6893 family small protein [unclassified Streptomyces]